MLVAVGDERVGRERKERERENHQRRKAENELFFFFLFFTKQRVGTCSFRFFSEEGEDSSVTSFLPLFLIFDGELLIYSFLMVRVWGKGDGTERNGRGAKREREREREERNGCWTELADALLSSKPFHVQERLSLPPRSLLSPRLLFSSVIT